MSPGARVSKASNHQAPAEVCFCQASPPVETALVGAILAFDSATPAIRQVRTGRHSWLSPVAISKAPYFLWRLSLPLLTPNRKVNRALSRFPHALEDVTCCGEGWLEVI